MNTNTKCVVDGCPITLPVEDMDQLKDGSYICPACSTHLDDMRREEISTQAQRMDEILADALDKGNFQYKGEY